MPIDPNIPLNAQPVQLPNFLSLAMQGRELKNATLQGNQLQKSMAANQAVSQAIQHNTRPDGTVDMAGVQSELSKNPAAGFNLQAATGQNLSQQGSQLANQGQQLSNAGQILDQTKKRYDFAVNQITPLLNKPDLTRQDIYGEISVAAKTFNMNPQEIVQVVSDVPNTNDPEQLKQYLKQKLMSAQTAVTQLQQMTPSATPLSTGQQITFANTNPNAGPVGVMPGARPIQMQLPPGTQVFNPNTQQMGYLGPQGSGVNAITNATGVQPPAAGVVKPTSGAPGIPGAAGAGAMPGQPQPQKAPQPGRGFIGSAPPIGLEQDVTQKIGAMNNDYQALQQANQGNAQARSALDRVKTLAPQALTGPASDKLSYANAILGEVGIKPAADNSTAYQLLKKNMNIVANAFGGNTDAARAMVEAANPNTHMTKEAIMEATDEVMSNISMNDAKAQYLGQFQANRDPVGYNQAKNNFNKYADARVWQFMDMTPEQRVKFKASLSPAEQKKFVGNIRALEQMGVIQ